MLKNDYRRALIMMRGLRQGVSGYIRLERRTLLGTLQFTVNGARTGENLYALLLYEQNGLWYACRLDKLGEPRYGQAGMVYRFDPRNICGRALESYALAAVAALRDGDCELILAGYLNGSVVTDWPQVRQAACQTLTSLSGTAQPQADAEEPVTEEEEEPPRVPTISPAPREEPPQAAAQEPTEVIEELVEVPPAIPQSDEFDQPAESAEEARQAPPPDEFDTPARQEASPIQNAGELLGIDLTRPWPSNVEALRQLFQSSAAYTPFEADGFVLIRVPVAAGAGADHCVVGISAEGGRPSRVLYGVPSRHESEPPSGLDGYEWRGTGEDGYWVIVRPVE
ncbi:MAG: hypothetical protein IJ048_06820 [Clostridia bacterium]|nr:hypothetical protein [Clostridia bacterium]